ncbi:hypothetical protein GUJ93_ZPchr0009g2127 [Zizania palustris]|uniref:Uncharacterized protein n=1 Tax=Zizania palustris TaxID=103762 RepID=A0A8J5RLF8_ZIZPA|nr:hypothetical protein GUJ93_ZPchr0009g2127 [Zizania palustris]
MDMLRVMRCPGNAARQIRDIMVKSPAYLREFESAASTTASSIFALYNSFVFSLSSRPRYGGKVYSQADFEEQGRQPPKKLRFLRKIGGGCQLNLLSWHRKEAP